MDKVRVGLVGCGVIADVMHLRGIKQMEEMGKVELVAVCDAVEDKAKAAAEKWEVPAHYTDLEQMLQKADFDLLVNTTQVPYHFEVSLMGLQAGKHVYTQKPMTTSVEQATRLVEEAKERDVLLASAPEHPVRPIVRKIRELVSEGTIGKVAFAKIVSSDSGTETHPSDVPRDCTWFYQPPTNPLLDIGVHGLSQIIMVLGPVKRVGCFSGRNVPTREHIVGAFKGKKIEVNIDDIFLVLLDFGQDRFGCLDATWCMLASVAPRLEIFGSEGVISVGRAQGKAPAIDVYTLSTQEWSQVEVEPAPAVRDLGVNHLVDCLLGHDSLVLTGEYGRHLVEITTVASEAAAQGCSLELSTTF